MSPRRDHTEDMRRLAAVIRQRVTDYDARHRRRIRIDPTLSRILQPDSPDVPADEGAEARPMRQNPGIFTVRDIASSLETTVGDLLGESVLGEADLQKLRDLVGFLIDRFDLMGARAAATRADRAFAVAEADFIQREYDYPRPHHVWIVRHAKAAAGGGVEADSDTETTEVLHSIRDVYNGQLRVIKVIGDSMAPVLRNDDKVVVDTRLTSPREGEAVAVYHHTDGGILGDWRRGEQGEFWLDKANDDFRSIRLDAGRDWTLWGTVTRIVDSPVAARPRRSR